MAVESRDLGGRAYRLLAEPREPARDISPPLEDLALADDHLFPPLRVAPREGESSLEHMLRQIDALMQGQGPRLLPSPVLEQVPLKPAKQSAPPRKPLPPRPERPPRARHSRSAVSGAAGAKFALALAIAAIVLLPLDAGLLLRRAAIDLRSLVPWSASRENAEIVFPSPPERPIAPIVFAPLPPSTGASPPVASPPDVPSESDLRPAAPPLLRKAESLAAAPPALEPAAPPPESADVPDRPTPAVAASAPAAEVSSKRQNSEIPVALLLERGNRLLAAGDVASARQFFERAAETGAPAAAFAMAKTFDPQFLRLIGAVGVGADTARAIDWYQKAAKAGDADAARRLQLLQREIVPRPATDTRLTDLRR